MKNANDVDLFDLFVDAPLIQLGTAVGESGSPLTSDGLYLLAGMDASSKGKLVALELDLDQGGSLEIQVLFSF